VKQLIIILFALLSFLTCFSQDGYLRRFDRQHKREVAKSPELKKIKQILSNEPTALAKFDEELQLEVKYKDSTYFDPSARQKNDGRWTFKSQVWRNMDFDVKQLIREILTDHYSFYIIFLVKNDTIIGATVSENEQRHYVYMYNAEFSKFINRHEEFYKTKIKNHEDDLGPFNFDDFGTLRGLHNSIIPDCELMIDAFNQGNKTLLISWLKSMNPERQAYAVQGLYYLNKFKHEKLSKEEESFVDHVKNLEGYVNSHITLNPEYFDESYILLREKGYIKE
jgi:hypothetical protein